MFQCISTHWYFEPCREGRGIFDDEVFLLGVWVLTWVPLLKRSGLVGRFLVPLFVSPDVVFHSAKCEGGRGLVVNMVRQPAILGGNLRRSLRLEKQTKSVSPALPTQIWRGRSGLDSFLIILPVPICSHSRQFLDLRWRPDRQIYQFCVSLHACLR